jgi:hypothetical protein
MSKGKESSPSFPLRIQDSTLARLSDHPQHLSDGF